MFNPIREHFARKAMIRELTSMHLTAIDVSHATYDKESHFCRATFTALSSARDNIKGTITLDRQKAFWVNSNHSLWHGIKY